MKNLNNIFDLNIVNIDTKFDYIFSLEIKGVLSGFKKMAKLEPFLKNDLDKIIKALDILGLSYSYFEKEEVFDEKNMLFKRNTSIESQYIDLYVYKDNSISNLLEKIVKMKDEKAKNLIIGKLLGYPECCIKSFLKQDYTSDISFNFDVKERTIGQFDWRLNNLINPYSLIPFFPCSYNCEQAIKYAENNLKIIDKREDIEKLFKNIILYNGFWEYEIVNDINRKNTKNIFNFKNS